MRFSNRDALALSHGICSSALNRDWERVAVGQPPALFIFYSGSPSRSEREKRILKEIKSNGKFEKNRMTIRDECGSIRRGLSCFLLPAVLI